MLTVNNEVLVDCPKDKAPTVQLQPISRTIQRRRRDAGRITVDAREKECDVRNHGPSGRKKQAATEVFLTDTKTTPQRTFLCLASVRVVSISGVFASSVMDEQGGSV